PDPVQLTEGTVLQVHVDALARHQIVTGGEALMDPRLAHGQPGTHLLVTLAENFRLAAPGAEFGVMLDPVHQVIQTLCWKWQQSRTLDMRDKWSLSCSEICLGRT